MSTPPDCSGGPIGLGTRRIAQRGLCRQTEGSGFPFSNDLILQDRTVASYQFKAFNHNIESLAKWIEGAIQRFRSGVKNSLSHRTA